MYMRERTLAISPHNVQRHRSHECKYTSTGYTCVCGVKSWAFVRKTRGMLVNSRNFPIQGLSSPCESEPARSLFYKSSTKIFRGRFWENSRDVNKEKRGSKHFDQMVSVCRANVIEHYAGKMARV